MGVRLPGRGDDRPLFRRRADLLPRYAWYQGNSQDRAWPVGQKRPNDLGLFDMHGNVWNWMADPGYRYPQGTEARAIIDRGYLYWQ